MYRITRRALRRTLNTAKLTIANRDTEGFCFKLEFDPENCKWRFIGNDPGDAPAENKPAEKKDELLCLMVDDFLKEEWSGTATELSDALNVIDESSGVTLYNIRTRLEATAAFLKDEFSIILDSDRKSDKRKISLRRQAEQQSLNDGMTV